MADSYKFPPIHFTVQWPEAGFNTLDGPQPEQPDVVLSALGGNYSEVGSGGLVGGGAATIKAIYSPTSSGGVLGGGSATIWADYFAVGSGGGLGDGTTGGVFSEVGSGGALGGGSALLSYTASAKGSGGALGGGSALLTEIYPTVPLAPAPCACNSFDYVGSGGAVGGSEAPQTIRKRPVRHVLSLLVDSSRGADETRRLSDGRTRAA